LKKRSLKNLNRENTIKLRLLLTRKKRRPSWLNRHGYSSLNRNALRWRDRRRLRKQKRNDLKHCVKNSSEQNRLLRKPKKPKKRP